MCLSSIATVRSSDRSDISVPYRAFYRRIGLELQMTAIDDGRCPGDALVLHVEDGLFLEDIDGELHLMDGSMD